MDNSMRIFLAEEDAHAEQLDEMVGHLRRELLQLDVDDVTPLRGEEAPLGTRGVGVVEIGALLVTLNQSATALRTIIHTVRNWRARARERPDIQLVIDGDVLVISDATPEQAARSFELFVSRHSTGGDTP